MSKNKILTLLTITLIPLLFQTQPRAEIAMQNYYQPLIRPGNTWTYEVLSGADSYYEVFQVLEETAEIGGETVRVLQVSRSGEDEIYSRFFYSEGQAGLRYHGYLVRARTAEGGYSEERYVFDPPITRYPAAVEIGDEIEGTGGVEVTFSTRGNAVTLQYAYELRILGFDNLTLPYGNFGSLVTEISVTMTDQISHSSRTRAGQGGFSDENRCFFRQPR